MNERDVFDAALAISDSQQRAAFLEQACGENQTQRREIEEMLDAQQRLGSFLHGPPAGLEATIDSPIVEKPGTQIGPYKLLQRIGEGGFGVVYMAEQHKPVRRKVALKIIKPGMDTKEVIARFEAERQALALMDHPNIAKVYDAGATDTGRPYFVMELVKGVPLIDFCDENHLTTKQRLDLFVKVCRAIQHAHQKGIIHRDLKPSNVMVTIHDNKPVPKVIDFGVSKAISQQLTEKTLFTAYGQMLGTPTYMSPEQAQMSGLDVDTRSDIYSLGVMLFELLIGSTPLDAERLRKSGYEEMQRLIREEEAPRPSQRLSTQSSESLARIARCRGADAGQLEKQLRSELDWIVIKALEKDRNRRYETANGFAADVERHLNHEAVNACPPSLAYRTRKFIHRNRRAALTAGTFFVATVLAMVGLSVGYIRATGSEVVARRASDQAQQEKQRAEDAMDKERQARLNAVAAGKLKDEALTDVYTTLGLSADEQGQTLQSRLYFANAARLAPDEQRARFNRIRSRSWANNMLVPAAVLPHSAEWIADIQFHAGGNYLMTRVFGAAHDNEKVDLGEINIWDIKSSTAMQIARLAPRAARWSPDGSWLAVVNGNGDLLEVAFPSLRVRRIATDIKAQLLRFSPSGHLLGIFGSHEARVWDCGKHEYATPPLPHPDFVVHLRFSKEEDRIVTACMDNLARVYAVSRESSAPLWEPVEHRAIANSIRKSLGNPAMLVNERLFTISQRSRVSGELVCRDAASGDVLERWVKGSGGRVFTDGDRAVLLTGRAVVLINTISLDAQPVDIELEGSVEANRPRIAATDPTSTRLALAGRGFLRIYNATDSQRIAQSAAISRNTNQIEFSPDGNSLVTAGRGGLVKVWRLIQRNPGSYHLRCGSSFANVNQDGRHFLPIGLSQYGSQLTVTRVYETETGRPASKLIRPGGVLIDGKFSPNKGDRLALATSFGNYSSRRPNPGQQPGELSIWNWRNGSRIAVFSLEVEPRSLDFSPDGSRIAVLSADGNVFVLDAATGDQSLSWSAHSPYRQNNWYVNNGEIAFSPDGSCIITWGADEYARFWQADSGLLRYELQHDGRVFEVSFGPDGKRFATAEWGGDRVQVWDFGSGRRVGLPMEHPDWPYTVRFSGDGTQIVSGCMDRAARVWDWQTGELVCAPMRHPAPVHAVCFLPEANRQLILTGCGNKTARVWECLTGKPVTPPIPIQGDGLTFSLTPNGTHVVIGGHSGLSVLSLQELLADDGQSSEELMAMAEFFSAHRISKGGLQRLTESEIIKTYEILRSKIRHELDRPGYIAPQVPPLISSSRDGILARIVARAFDTLDENSDGVLDHQDDTGSGYRPLIWERLLDEVTEPLDRGQFKSHCVRLIFDNLDEDVDGEILRREADVAGLGGDFDKLDSDRDAAITLSELERGFDQISLGPRILFPRRTALSLPKSLSPTEKFAEHDADGDGRVTKGEAGEDYWDTIKQFDDGDDVVDRAELEAGLREQSLASRRRFFAKADRNNDGQLNSEELRGLWEKSKSFDSDGDNQLNQDEFLKATEPKKEDDQSQPH